MWHNQGESSILGSQITVNIHIVCRVGFQLLNLFPQLNYPQIWPESSKYLSHVIFLAKNPNPPMTVAQLGEIFHLSILTSIDFQLLNQIKWLIWPGMTWRMLGYISECIPSIKNSTCLPSQWQNRGGLPFVVVGLSIIDTHRCCKNAFQLSKTGFNFY